MEPVLRMDADELVLTVPAGGIQAEWLARPLSELGLASCASAHGLRVEAPPAWRWSAVDAAFLAAVLGDVEGSGRRLDVRAVPKELQSLLELARAGRGAAQDRPSPRRPDIRTRVGALALATMADARRFVELIGQVVLLLPRYAAGRARIRRADVWELLADCGHRALPIVAIVNLLMGGILAIVGAVELQTSARASMWPTWSASRRCASSRRSSTRSCSPAAPVRASRRRLPRCRATTRSTH